MKNLKKKLLCSSFSVKLRVRLFGGVVFVI